MTLTAKIEGGNVVVNEHWTSDPTDKITSQNPTLEGNVMISTPLTEKTDFIYYVANAQEARCFDTDTAHVSISGPTFEIEVTSSDSLAICEGASVPLTVRPSMSGATNFELTSNVPGFTTISETVSGSAYTKNVTGWNTEGNYELWIKATYTQTGASAYDTVKVTVKPGASVTYADAVGSTADFCGTDSIWLNLKLGKGSSSSWKVSYLVGEKSIVQDFDNSTSTIKIGDAGTFKFVSVTNNFGCKVADDKLPAPIEIRDMTPKAVFASTVADSVCLADDATELAVTVSGGEAMYYPYTLFYHKDNGAAVEQLVTAAGEVKLNVTGTGTYTLDSIRNKNLCVARLSGETTVKDVKLYQNGVPEVSFDGTDFAACPGQQVMVPLNITGGMPDYTVQYKVGAASGTATVGADHLLRLPAGSQGALTLTQVADHNQCQDASLSGLQAQVTAGQQPTLALENAAATYTLCSGGGELELNFTAGQGGPEWILFYQWNGTAHKDTIRTADGKHTLTLTEGGSLRVDSVLNNLGCRFQPAGGVLANNITVTDDRPTVQFATSDKEGVCLSGVGESAPVEILVSNAGNGPATVWYHLNGQASQSAQVSKVNEVFTLGLPETGKYTLDSIFYSGCKGYAKNPLQKEIEIGSLDLTVALNGLSSESLCKPGNTTLDLQVLFSGTEMQSPENKTYVLAYDYVEAGLTIVDHRTQEVTLIDLQKKGNLLTLSGLEAGTYKLVGVSEKGGCSGKVSDTADSVNVMESPFAEIDSAAFAVKAGDTYVLGIATGANNPDYMFEWQASVAGSYTQVPGSNSIQGTMPASCADSIEYVLKTSTNASNCVGYDTVNVYRLPDAPSIRIDTNTNRNNIRIAWNFNGSGKVTGSTLWRSKWDAYALLDPNAYGSLQSSSRLRDTVYTIETGELDTLAFFYATANRYIPELSQTFYSGSSDTVGYYSHYVKAEGKATLNYIPYPFDMKYKASDFIVKIVGDYKAELSNFVMNEQSFTTAYYSQGIPGVVPPSWKKDFVLQVGMPYLLNAKKNQKILMYGKLPYKQTYTFTKSNEKGNLTPFYLPLHYITISSTGDIITYFENKVEVSVWDFTTQKWISTYYRKPVGPIPGGMQNSINVNVLAPFLLNPKDVSGSVELK